MIPAFTSPPNELYLPGERPPGYWLGLGTWYAFLMAALGFVLAIYLTWGLAASQAYHLPLVKWATLAVQWNCVLELAWRRNMTVEQVRQFYKTEPFQPFVMHLADGRAISVISREFMNFSPSGRTTIVYQPDDSFNVIDLLLVTDLEVKPPKKTENGDSSGKRRRNS